MRYPYQLS